MASVMRRFCHQFEPFLPLRRTERLRSVRPHFLRLDPVRPPTLGLRHPRQLGSLTVRRLSPCASRPDRNLGKPIRSGCPTNRTRGAVMAFARMFNNPNVKKEQYDATREKMGVNKDNMPEGG